HVGSPVFFGDAVFLEALRPAATAAFPAAFLRLEPRAAGTAAPLLLLLGFEVRLGVPPSTSCIFVRTCSLSSRRTSSSCNRANSLRTRSCSLRFAARSSATRCV